MREYQIIDTNIEKHHSKENHSWVLIACVVYFIWKLKRACTYSTAELYRNTITWIIQGIYPIKTTQGMVTPSNITLLHNVHKSLFGCVSSHHKAPIILTLNHYTAKSHLKASSITEAQGYGLSSGFRVINFRRNLLLPTIKLVPCF